MCFLCCEQLLFIMLAFFIYLFCQLTTYVVYLSARKCRHLARSWCGVLPVPNAVAQIVHRLFSSPLPHPHTAHWLLLRPMRSGKSPQLDYRPEYQLLNSAATSDSTSYLREVISFLCHLHVSFERRVLPVDTYFHRQFALVTLLKRSLPGMATRSARATQRFRAGFEYVHTSKFALLCGRDRVTFVVVLSRKSLW